FQILGEYQDCLNDVEELNQKLIHLAKSIGGRALYREERKLVEAHDQECKNRLHMVGSSYQSWFLGKEESQKKLNQVVGDIRDALVEVQTKKGFVAILPGN